MKAWEAKDLAREIRKRMKVNYIDLKFLNDMEECGFEYPNLNITAFQLVRLLKIDNRTKEGTQ